MSQTASTFLESSNDRIWRKAADLEEQIAAKEHLLRKYSAAAADLAIQTNTETNELNGLTKDLEAIVSAMIVTREQPDGKDINADLDRLFTVYKLADTGGIVGNLMYDKLEAYIETFRLLYCAPSGDLTTTRAWFHDFDTGSANWAEFTYRDGRWIDSDGKMLVKWRDLYIHDSGLAITSKRNMLWLKRNGLTRPHKWYVTYSRAGDMHTSEGDVDVDSQRPCKHEDKKRRTSDDD